LLVDKLFHIRTSVALLNVTLEAAKELAANNLDGDKNRNVIKKNGRSNINFFKAIKVYYTI